MKEGCSGKSAGTIVKEGGKILLMERMKIPFGFAAPAGHLDEGESFETCAKRELLEETGLNTTRLVFLIEGGYEGRCSRGGTWHDWKVYEAETQGVVRAKPDEMKKIGWYSVDEISSLAERTRKYIAGEISEADWEKSPGLEIVWLKWFERLGII